MRLGRMGDKPLRAAGVFAGEGHADGAAFVRDHVDLAADRPAGAAVAVAARVAVLHDEVRHDAMHFEAVEVTAPGELDEIVHGERRVLRQKDRS